MGRERSAAKQKASVYCHPFVYDLGRFLLLKVAGLDSIPAITGRKAGNTLDGSSVWLRADAERHLAGCEATVLTRLLSYTQLNVKPAPSDGHNDSPSPLPLTPASQSGQLTNRLNEVWTVTFVAHCSGVIRRLRNIRFKRRLCVSSHGLLTGYDCFTIIHFLVFQLLVVVEVVTSLWLARRT